MRDILLFASAVALASAALANDSTATSGAGGLVLKRTDAIDMISEDLLVSADKIRIHYVFRNRTPKDVETVVAFPMPNRDLGEEYGGDVAYPSGFRTLVAGKPVSAMLERRAVLKGKDYTALLTALHIPPAPRSIDQATAAMDRLPASYKRKLVSLGLASDEEYGYGENQMEHHLIALWTVRESYWWTQSFPAGRDVPIDHSYAPGTGGSVESAIAFKQFRNTKETKQLIADYCVDKDFIAAVDHRSNKSPDQEPDMPEQRVDYVLTTGANWARPIGDFRLIVDKGKPTNLVSFCEEGVKKISATQYEVRHSNWKPTRDLHVLIIEPKH
jgi:hypothetical protein